MDSSPLDVMSLPAGQGNPSLPLYKHCQLQGEEKRVILSRPSRRKSHTHTHTHTTLLSICPCRTVRIRPNLTLYVLVKGSAGSGSVLSFTVNSFRWRSA